jgi:protoporphyrinogen oxidase
VTPSVGIVGAGVLGLAAAYRLQRAGVHVDVFERSGELGGLVGSLDLDGHRADRFYHVTLPTDDRVRALAEELGLGDRFRFRPTRTGFYHDGELLSLSTIAEFLRFRPLLPHDRLRLGAFVARCQLTRSHARLDRTPLEAWLRRSCGRRTTERLWRPLLDSKFDGRFDDLPATYLWARTRRMSGTREGVESREVLGALSGGYQTMIDALADAIVAGGGAIHPSTTVRQIVAAGGTASGLLLPDGFRRYDAVLSTLLPPQTRTLLAPELAASLAPDPLRYLGIVCVLLRLARSASPYYTLNITDRSIPLTAVVETTHVVDPAEAGGTLVYLPRYVDPASAELTRPAAAIEDEYVGHLRRIFPHVRAEDVRAVRVQRAPLVEPIHPLGVAGVEQELFPAPGLALASTANVYPEIVNCQSVLGVADRVVAGLLDRLSAATARVA